MGQARHANTAAIALGVLPTARQHLDQPVQIFLAVEERLHQHAFVLAVHTHIVDIAGEPGMAVSRYGRRTERPPSSNGR